MISFQEGSTVSRTVMQKAGGNVVLFSIDTGEELWKFFSKFVK